MKKRVSFVFSLLLLLLQSCDMEDKQASNQHFLKLTPNVFITNNEDQELKVSANFNEWSVDFVEVNGVIYADENLYRETSLVKKKESDGSITGPFFSFTSDDTKKNITIHLDKNEGNKQEIVFGIFTKGRLEYDPLRIIQGANDNKK